MCKQSSNNAFGIGYRLLNAQANEFDKKTQTNETTPKNAGAYFSYCM